MLTKQQTYFYSHNEHFVPELGIMLSFYIILFTLTRIQHKLFFLFVKMFEIKPLILESKMITFSIFQIKRFENHLYSLASFFN